MRHATKKPRQMAGLAAMRTSQGQSVHRRDTGHTAALAVDLLLGLQTQEEVIDVQPVTVKAVAPSLDDLNAKITKPVVTAEPDDDIF